jgi:MerR family transcriptional regulator/heat shock protein HspR
MRHDPKAGLYMIGVVAARYEIHPQTLRLYEREGLLRPSRTVGKTRLYSDEDMERLEFILNLTRELGINLAGVDAILNLRDQMLSAQTDMQATLDQYETLLRTHNIAPPVPPEPRRATPPATGGLIKLARQGLRKT